MSLWTCKKRKPCHIKTTTNNNAIVIEWMDPERGKFIKILYHRFLKCIRLV